VSFLPLSAPSAHRGSAGAISGRVEV
jgi:hypothetical protein